MVMESTTHLAGVRRKFLTPAGLASNIKQLLGMLGTPRHVSGACSVTHTTLLLPDSLKRLLYGAFTPQLVDVDRSCVGVTLEQRAYLCRWMIGMTASEEYVRTARQIATKIRIEVNRVITTGRGCENHEDEIIEMLCQEAASRGANPARIRKRHTIMSKFTGRMRLGALYPTLVLDEDVPEIVDDAPEDQQLEAFAAKHAEQHSMTSEPKYFITVSRRAFFRRLHLTGCFVKASQCAEVRFADEVNVHCTEGSAG